jgi:hypothetical protein
MRKLLCALSLISALVFSLAVQAAAPANFAGTWTLDKSKSQNLNQRIQAAEVSVSWIVTQTDKTISIEEKVTGGQGGGPGSATPPAGAAPAGAPPAGGPPPAGGQGGGQGGGRGMGGGMGGPRTFNLDGTETTGEMMGGRGKFVRNAKWSNDGKTLELISKSTFQREGEEITTTNTDKLELSADGKVLTVARHSESPRGPQDSTWVLTKN